MFNFPNLPNPGDTFQPVGGPAYAWDGQKWVMAGSPITWTPAYDQRNRIVNPAMQISQENGDTATTVGGYYMADQWTSSFTTTGTITLQRLDGVTTPNGSRYRLRTTITVADASLAAGEYLQIIQRIEGVRVTDFRYGSAAAKQAILRFGFKGPAGTYSIALRNSANDRSYIAQFTISAAQANTDTTQTLVIPGDTTGTWLTGPNVGLIVVFCFAAGSTYQGTTGWQAGQIMGTASNTNGMATAGAVFELFDVGLYLDPTGSGIPPAWEMPDEAQELAACYRYWENGWNGVDAYGLGSNAVSMQVRYLARKRVSPTITMTNSSNTNTAATTGADGAPSRVDGFKSWRVATASGMVSWLESWVANARM